MNHSNIERFDQIATIALGLLYESFPIPRPLTLPDFNVSDECDEMGGFIQKFEAQITVSSLSWLASAGYISTKGVYQAGLLEAVLTAKGLEILKEVPSSIAGGLTIGEQLAGYSKTGMKAAAKEALRIALSIGAKFITG